MNELESMPVSDEFRAAAEAYAIAVEATGHKSAASQQAFTRMIATAPPEFMAACRAKLAELGLTPDGRTADGPVYSARRLSEFFGIPEDEIVCSVDQSMLVDPASVDRLQ